MKFEEFSRAVRNLDGPRIHIIHNSYGVYDYYKYYRKNRPKDSKYVLTEKQFYNLFRLLMIKLVDQLLSGNNIKLPHRMGTIELRKYTADVKIGNDGKVIYRAPIDWDATVKLWYEDKESYTNKVLVRSNNKNVFKVHYNKSKANFKNKSYYMLHPNRNIKKRLFKLVTNNSIEAFSM